MKRKFVLLAVLGVIIMACGKKMVPEGGEAQKKQAKEKATAEKISPEKTGTAVKSTEGSITDAASAAPAKDKESSTGPSGTNPATLPTGPNAPNKPSYEEMGKYIYTSKCNKCHGTKNAKNYTLAQWETILKTMIPNAKLSSDEESYVLAYIRANAKQ